MTRPAVISSMGAAALSAAVATPEMVRAAAALRCAAADWALATRDLEGDIAPRAMRLVHGRAPAGLAGTLFRNGPAKFRRPGGSATHWFDGDGLMRAFASATARPRSTPASPTRPSAARRPSWTPWSRPASAPPADDRARIGSHRRRQRRQHRRHGGRRQGLGPVGRRIAAGHGRRRPGDREVRHPARRPQGHAVPGPPPLRPRRHDLERRARTATRRSSGT